MYLSNWQHFLLQLNSVMKVQEHLKTLHLEVPLSASRNHLAYPTKLVQKHVGIKASPIANDPMIKGTKIGPVNTFLLKCTTYYFFWEFKLVFGGVH